MPKDYNTPPLGHRDDAFEIIGAQPKLFPAKLGAYVPLDTGYSPYDRYYPLCGLPGTVRKNAAVFVKPPQEVLDYVLPRCANGVLGGLRIVRSAELMKQNKLPVFAYDFHRIASFLIATVPYDYVHELFTTEEKAGDHG